jgi:hypothetical protein
MGTELHYDRPIVRVVFGGGFCARVSETNPSGERSARDIQVSRGSAIVDELERSIDRSQHITVVAE